MNNFNFSKMSDEDIRAKGNTLLGGVNPNDFSLEERKENLATLLVYKKMIDERFAEQVSALECSIDLKDFEDTVTIGQHKVVFKLKDTLDAKAIGMTNEELKNKYSISDDIISVDTKTIATLKKDKLLQAYNANITEILDAIKNGDLSTPTINKSRTYTIKK